MFAAITSSYKGLKENKFLNRFDDDLIDRLYRKYSVIFMITFATIVTTYQLVGKPIDCWCLGEYSDAKCNYAKTYCYITNSYVPLSNDTTLPKREELLSHKISYYQWVPFIFLLQALIFYAPGVVWKTLNSMSGFDIPSYVNILEENEGDSAKSDLAAKFVAQHILSTTKFNNNYKARGLINRLLLAGLIKRIPFKLTLSYLLVKILYALSAFVQMCAISYWLRSARQNVSISNLLFDRLDWNLSERFPRMTLCRFFVYILTESQPQWVQCTLPINIYVEKIYYFLRIWLWILFVVGIINCIYYAIVIFFRRDVLIERSLVFEHEDQNNDDNDDDDRENFNRAVLVHKQEIINSLSFDGLLVMQLLSRNISFMNYSKVVKELNKIIYSKRS